MFPELSDSWVPEETSLYDTVEYAVSELALNVVQHSRSDGFAHAQVYPARGLVRIAIADFGVGIRGSFKCTGSPHWNEQMTDLEAIHTAIKPKVSCNLHLSSGWGSPVNAGVGLTLLRKFAELAGGHFTVVSFRGFHSLGKQDILLSESESFSGTACAVTFPQKRFKTFAEMLEKAKREENLLGGQEYPEVFS